MPAEHEAVDAASLESEGDDDRCRVLLPLRPRRRQRAARLPRAELRDSAIEESISLMTMADFRLMG